MKIILAPDSFKGSLSASEVADILAEELAKVIPDADIVRIPIADGGEGTLDCFSAFTDGEIVEETVTGPDGDKLSARYLLSGDTAVIETASAAGITLSRLHSAAKTTTFGVGELISKAEMRGAKRFILGIGGSATNDGGCGLAAALGAEFFDAEGKKFIPVGETLSRIESITFPGKRDITVLCDVKNPLYGENGAAYVYAPQKGASPDEARMLDDGLRHYASVLEGYGISVADMPGAGAAGGLGAGLVAFFDAVLRRGIDTILELSGFAEKAEGADFVITGEGTLDSQSFSGKVIDGIIAASGQAEVIAAVGISKIANPDEYGLCAVFESNEKHLPFEQILPTAAEDMHRCAARVAEFIIQK